MKKKRRFLAAGLALTMMACIGFAACGENEGTGEAESVEGDSDVSEEVWNTALDTEGELWKNYKVEGEFTIDVGMNAKMAWAYTRTVADGKTHLLLELKYTDEVRDVFLENSPSAGKYELFYETQNEDERFIKQGETWVSEKEFKGGSFEEAFGMWMYSHDLAMHLREGYSDFVYDEKSKGYLLDYGADEEFTRNYYIFKIKEGKLAAIIYDAASGKGEYKCTYYLSDVYTFGGQTVESPFTE